MDNAHPASALDGASIKFYLVGGAVRDKLLGEPVKERDWVVVGATPEYMLTQGFQQVGKDFPVFLHPETKEEYALARTERKTAPGYTGFQVYAAADVTLEQDLERRDLTINAVAEAADGHLIDPFGGEQDLHEGLLRHVSPAFVEDPVRILRVARFAARFGRRGFRVAHGTNALMRKMVAAGEVDALVPERVWKELERALGETQPEKFFTVLQGCGALPRIFPELDILFGPCQGHAKTALPALEILRRSTAQSGNRAVRFAALVSPLAESDTGLKQIRRLGERLRLPTEYRELAELGIRFAGACRASPADAEALLTLLEGCDAFRRGERFLRFLELCRVLAEDAEVPARLQRAYATTAAIKAAPLVAQGLQGQAVGAELRRLRLEALAGED